MTKINAKTSTLSISLSHQQAEAIEQAAKRAHQSRSAYILSWLPETHQPDQTHEPNSAQQHNARRARVAQPV